MVEIFAVPIFAIFANFGQIHENKSQRNIISQVRENKSHKILQIQAFAKINLAKFRKKNLCTIFNVFRSQERFFFIKNSFHIFQNLLFAKIYLANFFLFDHLEKLISSFAKANPIDFTSPRPREI